MFPFADVPADVQVGCRAGGRLDERWWLAGRTVCRADAAAAVADAADGGSAATAATVAGLVGERGDGEAERGGRRRSGKEPVAAHAGKIKSEVRKADSKIVYDELYMPCDAGNITYYFNCIDLKEVNYRMPCDAGNNITYYFN